MDRLVPGHWTWDEKVFILVFLLNLLVALLYLLIGALIVWQHRANIQRLLHGTENKFQLHKKTE